MGLYLRAGHVYSDTDPTNILNGANLNEHVNEADLLPTAISSQILKDPAALTNKVLIEEGGEFFHTTLQQLYTLFIQPGAVVQQTWASYAANTDLPAVIPFDDSVPQSAEGTEILSVTITPRFSTSVFKIAFNGYFTLSVAGGAGGAAVFRAGTVSAIFAIGKQVESLANGRQILSGLVIDSPATTSALTYTLRVGPSGGGGAVMRMNGASTARDFGGVSLTYMVVEEIKQ
jgi:hypothetical protein